MSQTAADVAGVASAALSSRLTHNAGVATGIGLGVQTAAQSGVKYAERRSHDTEQQIIADAAGPLSVGEKAPWSVHRFIHLEPNEAGEVSVARVIGTGAAQCKEVIFSVIASSDPPNNSPADDRLYVTTICNSGGRWHWALAEPATDRWGALQ